MMTRDRWLNVLFLSGFFLLWQIIAQVLESSSLPAPSAVLVEFWKQLESGEMLYHLGITLWRVLVAFAVSMLIGTFIGILMGRYRMVNSALDGLLVLGLNIPALVTIILCYIWFGLVDAAAITAVAINKIPTVIVTVREGARAVDRKLLEVADAFHIPRYRKLFRVYLPQLYPYLMAAARSGLALIWKIVLVVELLGRSNGVGFQLGTYFQFFDITGILAYTFAFASVVLVVEAAAMRPIDNRISRWRS
ncbi:MAG: ABC transporter permease [Deltaproteobacteria bacterium]|jgi:NitT/TauT family transport system permease protein|nr:ABC transporter permease [Deltaproteobacteria bacterium]MBW2504165.1 ABC transporter permease [Deltaproteobacteria bacterium]MBW2519708.1 ABC transporter permease [Deltaproteobacteria bacterium]